jgi:hypothetical protein
VASPSLLLGLQLLAVEPSPAEVGQPVAVQATAASRAVAGLVVEALLPDGRRRELGRTDGDGVLRFAPEQAGEHRFVARIDGVRVIAPLQVLPSRRRWLVALACVPLGVVLLVRIWRLGRGAQAGAGAATGHGAG